MKSGEDLRAVMGRNLKRQARGLARLWSWRHRPAQFWVSGVLEQAPKAEALASQWIVSGQPVWRWFAAEWRRLGTLIAVLLTFGLLLHVVFGANGMVIYRQKRDELKELQSEVERIQNENEAYTGRIKALKSDPNAIEKEAREQLHYTRPGEMIYVFPQPVPKQPTGRAKAAVGN